MKLNKKSGFLLIVVGLSATLWILWRVITKPKRITYPCIQAASPLMAGFLLYLFSVFTSIRLLSKRKLIYMIPGCFLLFATLILVSNIIPINQITIGSELAYEHPANEPMGEATGIFPGRVVWFWHPDATNENCNNSVNGDGFITDADNAWFMDKNNNQETIDSMIDMSLKQITGEEKGSDVWRSIFEFHNQKLGKGSVNYKDGEKILIKLNRTSGCIRADYNADFSRNDKGSFLLAAETSPHVVFSVLKQLIDSALISQENIYVGDPMRNVYKEEYDLWHNHYPQVNYLGNDLYVNNIANLVENGRTPADTASSTWLYYANGLRDKFYTIVEEAAYIINIPTLKGHNAGGITLFAKNHFGSQNRSAASHLHPGLPGFATGYGRYRVLTDIMHAELVGRKELVYILDGLWAGPDWGDKPIRFKTRPFNNDWSSSIFVSLDPVAIESVAFDFLRTEFAPKIQPYTYPGIYGTDDHLHQAADSSNWPEGILYDPEKNGKIIPSLGVHEHWNNNDLKQYSRNLGTGDGIELVKIFKGKLTGFDQPKKKIISNLNCYPNPFNTHMNVSFMLPTRSQATLKIYSLNGKLMATPVINKTCIPGDVTLILNRDQLSLVPGNYILELALSSSSGIKTREVTSFAVY